LVLTSATPFRDSKKRNEDENKERQGGETACSSTKEIETALIFDHRMEGNKPKNDALVKKQPYGLYNQKNELGEETPRWQPFSRSQKTVESVLVREDQDKRRSIPTGGLGGPEGRESFDNIWIREGAPGRKEPIIHVLDNRHRASGKERGFTHCQKGEKGFILSGKKKKDRLNSISMSDKSGSAYKGEGATCLRYKWVGKSLGHWHNWKQIRKRRDMGRQKGRPSAREGS